MREARTTDANSRIAETARRRGLSAVSDAPSSGAAQGKIDQLIAVIERLCLSGAQYQLAADANGNINLEHLTEGAQGNVSVNIRQQTGGVGYLREEIRSKVEDHVRGCMAPYISQLIDVILDKPRSGRDAISESCVVTDPTGTPLNVRTAPNGQITRTLANGFRIKILQIASLNGNSWVYVSDITGQKIGWVFRPYVTCNQRE
jgi:hypothetical protein